MRTHRLSAWSALLALAGCLVAGNATAQVVSIEAPRPYAASCSNFDYLGNGVWAPNGAVLVNGHIILGRGTVIAPDTDFEGVKLGALLNAHCPAQIAGPVGPFAGHCGGWLGGCDEGMRQRMP